MRFLETTAVDGMARTGLLHFVRNNTYLPEVETPTLFPVVNLITGTTPRGGGIWKYILRKLFAAHSPMMTQALQFLDFGLTAPQLRRWIESPVGSVLDQYLKHYRDELPELGISEFRGPLFLDSGGFKFLGNRRPDLVRFGIEDTDDAWRGIVAIQQGIGGDAYVSLDYPLKPALADDEAEDLIGKSLTNAVYVLRHLNLGPKAAAFFAPCHGRDFDEMRSTVQRFFQRVAAEGLNTTSLGIAVGSLVPLRTVKKFEAMISILRGAHAGIPDALKPSTPIHVLGVTGSMIPILSYLGVDSFDSSSYVHHARTLEYYIPEKRCRVPFLELEMDELPCTCPACSAWPSYSAMHATMVGTDKNGHVKSEVYAAVALHNLYWDNHMVLDTRQAIRAGAMTEYLVDHARLFPVVRPAIDFIARYSTAMKVLLSRQYFTVGLRTRLGAEDGLPPGPIDLDAYSPGAPPWLRSDEEQPDWTTPRSQAPRRISLKYTPDSFVVPVDWRPAKEKDVLLVLPCSGVKPYRNSHSHQTVMGHLEARLASVGRIQKVTLSGLYGPVPAEYEDEDAIRYYDFRLLPSDEVQIQVCVRRLADFLRKNGGQFVLKVGYATSRAYRDVLLRVAAQVPEFVVLPVALVKQQLTEMYRREHLGALADLVEGRVVNLDRKLERSFTA
ncbi:MAG TPA: tRNA-guanine transglycosylase [Symbiobacteriaceae bacterium]|nr:tRNA-guanine transglycosylase [Symbiobacteriaceae bacterium]